MLRFLRSRHSVLVPNLFMLQSKTLIAQFSSLQSKPTSKSDRVIAFFKNHGLTETQISKITQVRPCILSANADKLFTPKFDFFLSIGIPKTHLPSFVFNCPALLWRSLENQLIPIHNFLKTVLADDETVTKMLLHRPRILLYDVENCIAPNINLLTQIGVSKTLISRLFLRCGYAVCYKHTEFKKVVELAIGMGFNPVKSAFPIAVQVLTELNTTTWDRKVMAYKRWGMSDKDFEIAFRHHLKFMSLSEEKLSKAMDIFVNEMGRKAAEVARSSNILSYSVENRIKPRCGVIKVLTSKGLLEKNISLQMFLKMKEPQFLKKVPDLLKVYQEKQIRRNF